MNIISFLFVLLCLQLDLCHGESYNSSATSFYFGFLRDSYERVTISTLAPFNVTYYFDVESLSYTTNGTVTKNRPSFVDVDDISQIFSSSFTDRFKGIHVTSDQPISLSDLNFYSEHLILPYHEYPGVSQYEYYAVSTSSYRNAFLSQVLLVGCINNTVISIIPTVDLVIPIDVQKNGSDDTLVTKGNSHTITLHEGQTLLLGKGNGSDISGTHFISNKPLTVTTGHQCGSTPDMIERFSCNTMQLQVPPTITWGKRFILTNFINFAFDSSIYSSYVKTVTSQANTSITIHCDGATNTTRYSTNGAIGTYQYNITGYCYVEADKSIFVVLFPQANLYSATTMVLIPPMEQYLQEVNVDHYGHYSFYSKLVITASIEGFSTTAILHNGLATVNWTAIYDSSSNIVAYGTEIAINEYSNHSVVHTSSNGKLSVQVQWYFFRERVFGWPAVVSLEQSVIPVCNFSCGNGTCVANNLCQCFDGWTGDICDEVLCSPVCGNGYCVPTNSCVCNPGWTGDRCRTDINECSLGVCNQTCINTQGSYTCECNIGYLLRNDSSTCEDINECETVDHNCTQICSNTVGSYTCSCRAGYKDNRYGNCTDIDECSMGTSGCQQLCFNTNGSYYCQCNTGYRLMNDNSSCDDINECIEDPGVCPLRSNCINTLGSYQCNCFDGYQMDNTGMCVDIDECVTGTHSCQQRCINTEGSYNCSCYDGFMKRFELFCFDIDECSNDLHNCSSDQVCHNTVGSFSCSCREGFVFGSDGVTCELQPCHEILVPPVNGNVTCPTGRRTNDTCSYSCNTGYQLMGGSSQRTCQSNGRWSGRSPSCSPLPCQMLPAPENGYLQLPCAGVYQSQCTIRCFDGYVLTNTNDTVSQVTCGLTANNETMWSDIQSCTKTDPCAASPSPCLHGGKCSHADNDNGFVCNCTGTLYEGETCERGLLVIDPIGSLKSRDVRMITIRAKPDNVTTYYFEGCKNRFTPIQVGYFLSSCSLEFSKAVTSRTVSLTAFSPGSFYLKLDYINAPPVPFIISGSDSSPYFDNQVLEGVQPSCCGNTLQICTTQPTVLKSSCSWNTRNEHLVTRGIVFIEYDSLKVPLSLAGLEITTDALATTLPPSNSSVTCSSSSSCSLTPLNRLSTFTGTCYQHMPTPEDLSQFVSNQSLTITFLSSIRSSLFPSWFSLDKAEDMNALNKLSNTDYLAKLVSSDSLLTERGCESLVIENIQGQFILLQHNGPLNLNVMNELPSILPSPSLSNYYCIAVHVCSGQSSPIHIGLPPSAQDGIKRISFIFNYVNKGWTFNFKSATLTKIPQMKQLTAKLWNGIAYERSSRANIQYDTLVNMETGGQYSYEMTNVNFNFSGFVRYNYVTDDTKANIALLEGDCTLRVMSQIGGSMEKLELKLRTTDISIYYQGSSTTRCSTQSPSNGVSFKLAYTPQQDQPFYLSVLELPFRIFNTSQCPVDVFLSLNSSQDMNGLSFYSECLDVSFDALLLTSLSHSMYIPMSNDTLCTKPHNFTSLFPYVDFGLLIHSSLDTDRVRLNNFIQLLPGYDGTAVSLGFYRDTNESVGLIHSADITMFGVSFETPARLCGDGLTFDTMTGLFNEEFYTAHLQGLASTSRQWKNIIFNVGGWFPKSRGSFADSIEKSVRENMRKLGEAANMRKQGADGRLADAITGVNRAAKQLAQAHEAVTNSSNNLNQAKVDLVRAMNRLNEAERNVTNATSEIEEAEAAVDNVCQQRTCQMECQNATRKRTIYEDTYYTAEGTCDSECDVIIRERVAPFTEPTVRWQYTYCCWNVSVRCGDQLCNSTRCSYVCKAVPATRPVFNYRPRVIKAPCVVSCLVRQYNTTIEKTEEYIDPCGRRAPNATCVAMNAACNREREIALRALEMKRRELVEPLRERNRARETVALLEIRVSQAERNNVSAIDNLASAQVLYDSSVAYKDSVNTSHSMILQEIRTDLRLYDITRQNGNNVFIVTNVTFSVSISEINNPSTFPITISYSSQGTNGQLSYTYQFNAPFSSQEENLVDILIDNAFDQSRRKRRQTEEGMLSGREQFEIRCTQLKSIESFIQYMLTTLEETKRRGRTIQKNLLELIESVNVTLNETSISNVSNTGNYTSIKELYGLTDEDIEESRRELGNMEDEVLDSVKSSYKSLQDEAQSVLDSLNTTLLNQWRSDLEILLENNGTVAGRSCLGLADCIIVLNSSLDNLLSFAPSGISVGFVQQQMVASQSLLELATNELTSFNEARNKLAAMDTIVNGMISNGYWCSTPPQVIVHPVSETSVQIGTRLTLTCTGNSSLPITYQWRKDGVTLPDTNSNTLILDNMQVFDEGNYSCEVTNDVSSQTSTNSSVHVFILPQFFQLPSPVITYTGDENGAYFTCNATSRPDPGWRWYHRSSRGGSWREMIGEETNEILVRNPSRSDEGEYRCVAYNDFGDLSSEPVSLRLVSVTVRVLAYSIDITMTRQNDTENRTSASIGDSLRRQFMEGVSFGNVSLSGKISVREILSDDILVNFKLISQNVSRPQTASLETIVSDLLTARSELDKVRNELEIFLESSESFELEYKDSLYKYSSNSFSVDIPEIHCSPGQELHSSRFLCSDCLEGQEQMMKTESRFTGGRTVTERVPRCSPCPLNTYQNIVGGGPCRPCPVNHVTFITGSVSVDQCSELCPVNHNSSNGLMPCRPCPQGTYQPTPGEVECLTCSSETDDPLCSKDPCEQPKIVGTCNEERLRFYYDDSLGQCQPFMYSGCDGNDNNFHSLNECSQTCGCPMNESSIIECTTNPCLSSTCLSAPTAQCFPDYCDNCTSRYYYNDQEVTDTCSCRNGLQAVSCAPSCLATCQTPEPVCPPSPCVPGCGCPDDTVYDEVKQECVSITSCDTCSLPSSTGPCHGVFPRWFYNSSSGGCELFSYGGCGGNNNRFTSLQQCTASCGCGPSGPAVTCGPDLCKTSSCEAHDNSVCEIDSCSNCTVKHYVGLQEVTEQCDVCDLPPVRGECRGSITRWYFNGDSGRCERFTYGGCQGNRNNFKTLSSCLQTCARGNRLCDEGVNIVECYSDPCSTTHCPNFENALCIPNHCGECSAHYYNTSGHDITMMCSDCPPERSAVRCVVNPCDHRTCPNLPPTQCVLDVCGECKAHYYFNNVEVTEFCMTCPSEGQVFKDCGGSCERTCSDILLGSPFVCDRHYCVPGCACPAGQVLDELSNKCVYPEQCLCRRSCDPIPANCSRISYDKCNCTICRDCPIAGQEYNEVKATCPKTCSNPHVLCAGDGQPGCSCPLGQVIDEMNKRCVSPNECPKPDPCTLAPERGPCTASITRYHYNVTSQMCQQFSYGGCFPNENNFFTQHDCEDKCSDCYPVCTPEYCAIYRRGTCSVPLSPPGSTQGCPGGCAISNCGACYYSYNDLPFPPLPGSCPSVCPLVNGQVDESCMARWGQCVQTSYYTIYKTVSERERFKDNFRCWSHQCIN